VTHRYAPDVAVAAVVDCGRLEEYVPPAREKVGGRTTGVPAFRQTMAPLVLCPAVVQVIWELPAVVTTEYPAMPYCEAPVGNPASSLTYTPVAVIEPETVAAARQISLLAVVVTAAPDVQLVQNPLAKYCDTSTVVEAEFRYHP
jgi:hypothetical protein